MKTRYASLLIFVLNLGFGVGATASVEPLTAFSGHTVDLLKKNAKTQSHVYVTKDSLRADSGRTRLLYSAKENKMWILDLVEKTYVEITERDAISATQRQDAEIEKLRKKIYGSRASVPAAATFKFEKTGTKLKVSRWSCEEAAGQRGGRKDLAVCMISPAGIGIGRDQQKVIQNFSSFASRLPNDGFNSIIAPLGLGFGGDVVSLKSTIYNRGLPSKMAEVSEVRALKASSTAFQVPAGFRKIQWTGLF